MSTSISEKLIVRNPSRPAYPPKTFISVISVPPATPACSSATAAKALSPAASCPQSASAPIKQSSGCHPEAIPQGLLQDLNTKLFQKIIAFSSVAESLNPIL